MIISWADGWCSRTCKPSAGSRSVGLPRRRSVVLLASRTSWGNCHRLSRVPDAVQAHTRARRADFSSKMLSQHAGTLWEVTRVRVTAKDFHDAKKCGPHADICFFLLRNMRRGTDPMEPGHVSTDSPIQAFPLARLADVRLLAGNDPLSQEALGGLPWPNEWSQWPRSPASFCARKACTHRKITFTNL